MSITKVALTSATDNLGLTVLKELISAGFEVTLLSRSSNHKADAWARIVQVDYNSVESLTNALSDHDALVVTLGQTGLGPHLNLANEAVAANVKHIIPSKFGSDTTNPRAATLSVSADKVAVQARLKKLAAANHTSYTLMIGALI